MPGSIPIEEFIEEWIPLLENEKAAVLFILDEEEAIGSDAKTVEEDIEGGRQHRHRKPQASVLEKRCPFQRAVDSAGKLHGDIPHKQKKQL